MKSLFSFLLAMVLGVGMAVQPALAISGTFSDLSTKDVYYESISNLVEKEIVKGTEEGFINPTGYINRAELTVIVIRTLKITPTAADRNCFPDVQEQWFAGPICAAKRLKIVNGYPDGLYRPGRKVTSGEAAKIMLNALTPQQFSDLQQSLDYLEKAQLFRQSYANTQNIKRNEVFERLYRIMNLKFTEEVIPEDEPEAPGVEYVELNASRFEGQLGKTPMILFFHAKWCPLCQKSDKILTDALEDLEGRVIWFKVDYDTEHDLKKDYKVTIQDTFIVIDASGGEVLRRSGLPSAATAQDMMDAALN